MARWLTPERQGTQALPLSSFAAGCQQVLP